MFLRIYRCIFFICFLGSLSLKAYDRHNLPLEFVNNSIEGKKRAIVSGQSIIGMLAAAVLAKSGYEVDCFEIREVYSRNIQWAIRQSLVDELTSIDENLADAFLQEIARPIYRGSIHVYTDGYRRVKNHDGLGKGDSSRLPATCVEMMAYPSVAIVEAKMFEEFLKKYLQTFTNITLHNTVMNLHKEEDRYYAEGLEDADLIVIAEGFNSRTRKSLDIELIPSAENKLQIAGTIEIDSGGVMIKHWREEEGKTLLTGIMGRAGSSKTWLVADVDPSKVDTQSKIVNEFRRLAKETLGVSYEDIASKKISGVTSTKPICPFLLKQAVSSIATHGENLILIGDAVGTGHWCVGGGMQTAAVCHIESLRSLIFEMEFDSNRKSALKNYSDRVLSDTKVWVNVSSKNSSCIVHTQFERSSLCN